MQQLWAVIGFTPTTFELPPNDSSSGDGDKPMEDASKFPRAGQDTKTSPADQERFCGVNNFPLEMSEDAIMKFLEEHVTRDISKDTVSIMRYKKTISAIVTAGLTSEIVTAALNNIDFPTSSNYKFKSTNHPACLNETKNDMRNLYS